MMEISRSQYIVNVANVLTPEQQEKLGTKQVSINDCSCPTCQCEPEYMEVRRPYYVRKKFLDQMREELSEEQVVKFIQWAFDNDTPSSEGIPLHDFSDLMQLENTHTKFMEFCKNIGKHTDDPALD